LEELPKKKTAETLKQAYNITDLLKKSPKQVFYTAVQPMLATLIDKPFDDQNWVYEVKWDGHRALAFMKNGKIELKSYVISDSFSLVIFSMRSYNSS
jgi:bifunctional non-homologous end joining protein LigD